MNDPVAGTVGEVDVVGPPPGFGRDVHEYLYNHVSVADAKVGILVAADLTVAGLLLGYHPIAVWVSVTKWLALLVLMTSAVLGSLALFPRLPSARKGLIFWEDILTGRTADDYCSDLTHLDLGAVEREYAFENHYLSIVLHAKFRSIQWCFVLFLAGFVLAAISRATP